MQKAIEKRVDNLLSQSPKALAAMASQITDDTLASIMKGSSEEDAMAALTEFMHKYVKPMDARTYHEYRDEYELLREHYWMNVWLKAETKLAELHRDYLRMLKAALTAIKAGDHMRELAYRHPMFVRVLTWMRLSIRWRQNSRRLKRQSGSGTAILKTNRSHVWDTPTHRCIPTDRQITEQDRKQFQAKLDAAQGEMAEVESLQRRLEILATAE